MGERRRSQYVDAMPNHSDRQPPAETSPLTFTRSPELMRAGDTLLLLVDVQERLVGVLPDSERIIWNCRRLLDAANLLDVRVAATEQVPGKLGPTLKQLRERLPTDPLAKRTFSSCGAEAVQSAASEGGIERVLLCGIETHVCVGQSACDLLAAGLQVLIAVDAVGARHQVDHETALRRLELSGALLTTTEAAMFEWCETADRPEFKQISALAKETCSRDA